MKVARRRLFGLLPVVPLALPLLGAASEVEGAWAPVLVNEPASIMPGAISYVSTRSQETIGWSRWLSLAHDTDIPA